MWEPTQEEINELKTINGEQSAAKDETYRVMLPILFEHVEEYCNYRFPRDADDRPLMPGGVKMFIAKVIQHNQIPTGLSSRKMGTVSYDYSEDIPQSLYSYIRRYRKVRFHAFR